MPATYAIGIDYGTNSVRALVVDCSSGRELGSHVFPYPGGSQGIVLDRRDPECARQRPRDYLAGLQASVQGALKQAGATRGFSPSRVIALGVDTTGSTPLPVDATNNPLAAQRQWSKHLAAQAWLWKDHTSANEAAQITRVARALRPHYLAVCGGTYSSEWFWAKVLHCLRTAPDVYAAAYSWVECADWIPSQLAGCTNPLAILPGICPAGHKALYSDSWGGYPDKEFLAALDPGLAALRDRLPPRACDASTPAGYLCRTWAQTLGLPAGIPIAIGAFDAHTGAVGAGVKAGTLVKVIGTSTCDLAVSPLKKPIGEIAGICGIVPGSILPAHYGIEAGQSAVGDIFKWFVETVCQGGDSLHARLTREAARLEPGQSGLLALDWNNGNRTVLVDPALSGLLLGQTLHTTRSEIYRALIEGTAFGARVIIERIRDYGVPITSIICTGGIAEKNPLLMQIYADVCNCTMQVSRSSQTCALGSAVLAAACAGTRRGGHPSVRAAQKAMTGVAPLRYVPRQPQAAVYNRLYALYRRLHDGFGGVAVSTELGDVMKELIALRREVIAAPPCRTETPSR